jgi:hypothetical protein
MANQDERWLDYACETVLGAAGTCGHPARQHMAEPGSTGLRCRVEGCGCDGFQSAAYIAAAYTAAQPILRNRSWRDEA